MSNFNPTLPPSATTTPSTYGEATQLQIDTSKLRSQEGEHFNLGCTLYRQKKYSEAERLFRQAVNGHEKELGCDHSNTPSSKHWLGCTLYK